MLRHVISTLRPRVLALACLGAAFLLAHAAMERLCVWAECDDGAYLWWREEMMQLFTPTNYVGRGEGRIIITGPSEIREALLPDVMSERLGRECYQNAISLGTLDAVVMQLEYVERFYGHSAMPDAFIIGATPRFAAETPPLTQAPFRDYVARFSPWAFIAVHPLAFEDKDPLRRLAARARLLAHQPRRYKGALLAVYRRLTGRDDHRLHPSKFHHRAPMPKARYFDPPRDGEWTPWDLDEIEPGIRRGFGRIRDLCKRHDVKLFLVAMPQGSWARTAQRFPPGYYEKFLRLIRSASGVEPLNLRTLLPDREFHDWTHATRAGAARVTRVVCGHIMASMTDEER